MARKPYDQLYVPVRSMAAEFPDVAYTCHNVESKVRAHFSWEKSNGDQK